MQFQGYVTHVEMIMIVYLRRLFVNCDAINNKVLTIVNENEKAGIY